jgi:type IV pilus assembly protein PilY1
VASSYACHGACNCQTHSGTKNLSTAEYHRLVVRHSENGGNDGVKVWYKKPGSSSWEIFGNNKLTLRAPNIVIGTNECTIKNSDFIDTGTPSSTNEITAARRHLFCNTTLSDGGTPILRLIKNVPNRIWDWSAKERPVCNDPGHNPNNDYPFGSTYPTDYTVRVEVCNSSVGNESNCKDYDGTYKPTGLLQKYGEGDGTKVCSKTFSKTCNSDSNCEDAEGLCIDKSLMYFGLMTGSYEKNLSGGVLRKNVGSITDETNLNNGIFQTSENVQGNIIHTLDRMKIVGYDYADYAYDNDSGGSCGWIETRPLQEGECRNWGNPVAEMLYETLRYFGGKADPTGEFTYSDSQDSGLNLSKPDWGYPKGSERYKPYDIFPSCSKPFVLILSDINPSYDSDQIPGSSFTKTNGSQFSEDSETPQLGLGTTIGGVSLLNRLTDTIGTQESIANNSWFIGENGSIRDTICTSKNASKLSLLRGMCPEEPTKMGSYYTAALAYYGHTLMKTNTGKPDVTTFAVALSSPVANIRIKVGDSYVTLVPTGKSVSGSNQVYESCAAKCTLQKDDNGLHISACSTDAFCPTNQIVNMFVDSIEYNSSNEPIYARFRINFEDSEQGADHDMDAIVSYEICTQAAVDANLGQCGGSLGSGIQVKLRSEYGAGSIDQALGFVISGTTEDGVYLPVKDKDVGGQDDDTPQAVADLQLEWSKTFTPSGSATGFLKNPLWYAAKWGGFTDSNGDNMPDLATEWARNDGVNPDNYYLVVNPLRLEQQLDKALSDILAKTSSGTAASIVNNRGQSGANILSAIFYPLKDFGKDSSGNDQQISWLGDLQNFWYYFDPYINNSTIREDTPGPSSTVGDNFLNLVDDYKVDVHFDPSQNKTVATRYSDDGHGNYTLVDDNVDLDDLFPLWRAGDLLYQRNLTTTPQRKIYTTLDGFSFLTSDFTTANKTILQPYLDVADAATAEKIIKYVIGYDTPSDSTLRNRSISYNGITPSASTGVGVWKLGDIIDSTPKVQSSNPLNGYHLDYGDASYRAFINSSDYASNAMVYAGANDGMLHAFRLGKIIPSTSTSGTQIAQMTNPGSSPPTLGSEVWAFIPRDALPYLKYLSDPGYTHLYYVDNSPLLVDASINKPTTGCTATDYWNCAKQTTTSSGNLVLNNTSWRTILVGSMGLGGASRQEDQGCNSISGGSLPDTLANCVKSPLSATGFTNIGLSSYFALNVTSPENPSLMWEFSDPDLGYSTVDPVVVRVNGKKGGSGPGASDADPSKNGRWFLVFASGPTGPIEPVSHQFYGRSDKTLKIFVVDLNAGPQFELNSNYWVFDTGISNAFAGSLATNGIDADKNNKNSPNYYGTDVVYIGYVKPRDATYSGTTVTTWTNGGILRLVTKGDTNPANWRLSTLIDNVGPVTASIDKLYDDKDKSIGGMPSLWLYFGTGRYFFKNASGIDSATDQMTLYGIKDPCYSVANVGGNWVKDMSKSINPDCTTQLLDKEDSLTNQSSDTPYASLQDGHTDGWFINLDPSTAANAAERVITTPSARTNGMVLFTTFKPTADICGFGGETFFWFTDYSTGGPPPEGTLKGKVIIQLSTGAIVVIDLSRIHGDPGSGGGSGAVGYTLTRGGRQLDVGAGKPPTPPPASDTLKKPVKKVLQIQEK